MKQKVTILGAGESGVGAARLAHKKGYAVFVSSSGKIEDKYRVELMEHAIEFEERKHTIKKIIAAQFIIKSPGVPFDIEPLRRAQSRGVEIIDEVEFAFRHLQGKIIGISGTNGKTTVAHLVYHLMRVGGANVALAGNVGTSLSRKVMEKRYDWYVVELSSFQLEGIKLFKPDISILLNITPDHLDRYNDSFAKYRDAKFRLVKNTTESDYFIYYMDDPYLQQGLANRSPKAQQLKMASKENSLAHAFFDGKKIHFPLFEQPFEIVLKDTTLNGLHNSVNGMAAALAAYLAGITPHQIKKGMATFNSIPHRMESVATLHGIEFVNDSKATNVDATRHALESYTMPLIWIAGGVDKGNNYDPIRKQVQEKVKMILCLGAENKKIKNYFSSLVSKIKETRDIKELVKMALDEGDKGDVVLLSPACSSFDLFANYEDRGNQFRQAVLQLKKDIKSVVKL